jgi:hypothetical protein
MVELHLSPAPPRDLNAIGVRGDRVVNAEDVLRELRST